MHWNRKQRRELCNLIMKCFLAVKPDQVLASAPVNQLQELVHSASGYGSVKEKRGCTAFIWGTLRRCYIKISIWPAVPGNYSSHFEVKWRKRIPPAALPLPRQETYTVTVSLCPTGQKPEVKRTYNQPHMQGRHRGVLCSRRYLQEVCALQERFCFCDLTRCISKTISS